jgi:hypothetical protein
MAAMAELERLIDDLPAGLLPPGRLVASYEGGDPLYWLSGESAAPGMWARLREVHATSGLWPVLLGGLDLDDARPWELGEVFPADMTPAADHDVDAVLAGWWAQQTDPSDDDTGDDDRAHPLGPYRHGWPGLAPAGTPLGEPEDAADALADWRLAANARLGLVAAERSSDVLWLTGWSGPVNHEGDVGRIAAVVRSWEERFGARVVLVGFDTLELSVAAPPRSVEEALPIAAEHFAFCPDLVWQSGLDTIPAYAEAIVDVPVWMFWWD